MSDHLPSGWAAAGLNIFLVAGLGALSGAAAAGGGNPSSQADFQQETASPAARHVANWVATSGDNKGLPYVIIDKIAAKVFVFDAGGKILGAQPALLGMGIGDSSNKDIGGLTLSQIIPSNRTTPAGRFMASQALDLKGQSILWIDYEAGVALHRVIKGDPEERRAARLESATPEDNRISYGCINVPVSFYDGVIQPAFSKSNGIVYILPETPAGMGVFSQGLSDRASP